MPDTSARLDLPYLQPAQAQKHVTHNAALTRLDALVQCRLDGIDSDTPPASPAEGALYAVGAAPTGDWSGQAGQLALFDNGGWQFLAPQTGWQAWDQTGARPVAYDGSGWSAAVAAGLSRSSAPAGEMCRLADGSQMLWTTGDLVYDSAERLLLVWSFPAGFVTSAPISVTAQLTGQGSSTPGIAGLGALVADQGASPDGLSVSLHQYRQTGASAFQPGDTLEVTAMALGRWL